MISQRLIERHFRRIQSRHRKLVRIRIRMLSELRMRIGYITKCVDKIESSSNELLKLIEFSNLINLKRILKNIAADTSTIRNDLVNIIFSSSTIEEYNSEGRRWIEPIKWIEIDRRLLTVTSLCSNLFNNPYYSLQIKSISK